MLAVSPASLRFSPCRSCLLPPPHAIFESRAGGGRGRTRTRTTQLSSRSPSHTDGQTPARQDQNPVYTFEHWFLSQYWFTNPIESFSLVPLFLCSVLSASPRSTTRPPSQLVSLSPHRIERNPGRCLRHATANPRSCPPVLPLTPGTETTDQRQTRCRWMPKQGRGCLCRRTRSSSPRLLAQRAKGSRSSRKENVVRKPTET